ncbi:class I SAM-dependent methyltransferase [Shewanella sp. NIFS-20-20]|uniref:class I SAM-dependent methyltransferase n=1 Tax=Shewanella sp. NIFS-20-20 TaxID=2853806 RepID=UPI001C45A64C|nr:class I SAM-dependent methyltransferase [Shewanella sp. NIFS-20-20]MBV7316862.1 class I SAM-dependent methyltransferase [Shewanella sp. NIFS-20-20]
MQSLSSVLSAIHLPLGGDSRRLFHGRGGKVKGLEHICLDWFEPVVLLTSFKPLTEAELDDYIAAIQDWWSPQCTELNLVYQCRAGIDSHSQVLLGQVPDPHWISEAGIRYRVHIERGQNHGLFLDMANGRRFVQQHARAKKVLNLFAYTCGFSLAALKGGATEVVNIDMSKGAIAIGKQNHNENNFTGISRFLPHDIFKSWGKLKKLGPYDLIIVDPPSNQKGSFVATKDYVRLLRRLPELLSPDAELLLCLNAPELSMAFLQQQVAEASLKLQWLERLPNPEVYADVDEERSLKVLRYRLVPAH